MLKETRQWGKLGLPCEQSPSRQCFPPRIFETQNCRIVSKEEEEHCQQRVKNIPKFVYLVHER